MSTTDLGSRSTHLVVYFDANQTGGAEVTMAQVMGGLPERFAVTFVGVERGAGDQITTWVADHRPGSERRMVEPIQGARDHRGVLAHRRLFRELRPDIVHFNLSSASGCQWAMAAAVSIRGLPVVAVENSPMRTWSRNSARLKRWNSPRLAAHVAVGERTARMIEADAGLRPGSIGTMYHGVADVRRDGPPEPGSRPVIVNVARHDPVKGIDVLLEAMTRLPDVRLVQIGDGPETAQLTARRRELGLEDRVEFRPIPWGDRVADRLAGFDLFVLSSRVEGLPVTIMEAMLAGRAVVATDVGSVREEVIDGETGRVVPAEDPDALAAAIRGLLADAAAREAMGRRAREIASETFTVEATVARYTELFDRVTAQARTSAG